MKELVIDIKRLYIDRSIADFTDYKNLYTLYCTQDEFSMWVVYIDRDPYYSFKKTHKTTNTLFVHSFRSNGRNLCR